MPRARVKSSLHHTKMDNLAFLWDLRIILIQLLFLPISHSLQPHIPIQRNPSKLGRDQLVMLLIVERRSGRNRLQVMHQVFSGIDLKGRKPQLRYLVHSYIESIHEPASAISFLGAYPHAGYCAEYDLPHIHLVSFFSWSFV